MYIYIYIYIYVQYGDLATISPSIHRKEAADVAKRSLLKICQALDEDSSGCLTLDELTSGWEEVPEFEECMQGGKKEEQRKHTIITRIINQVYNNSTANKEETQQQTNKQVRGMHGADGREEGGPGQPLPGHGRRQLRRPGVRGVRRAALQDEDGGLPYMYIYIYT